MPKSYLFGVSVDGTVYSLEINASVWNEVPCLGLEFKSLSAVPNFLWAIGADSQVYVYVYGLDIPIRVKEVAFENQRQWPTQGFSGQLMLTDRYPFSTEDGLQERQLDSIHLPSSAWSWDTDWTLECTLDGQILDHDAWTYAIDFPATYSPQKKWYSCVRRRKWCRYRRYMPLNSWYALSPLRTDRVKEIFNDVSVGGHMIPGAAPGTVLVWAVTARGRVLFRSGVDITSPEGSDWVEIPSPSKDEIKQVSIGPTGLVWAILWSGRVVVRSGVTRDCLQGVDWNDVAMPGSGLKISQLSVGTNAVWAVTNTNTVWFRRGVQGEVAGLDVKSATGTGWVEMVGQMANVSVTSGDQVFAVGCEDRVMYFRTGVTSTDLTGKTWRPVTALFDESSSNSAQSVWFRSESSQSRHRRSPTYSQQSSNQESNNTTPLTAKRKLQQTAPTQASSDSELSRNSEINAQNSSPCQSLAEHGYLEKNSRDDVSRSDVEEKSASESGESDLCSQSDTLSISRGPEPSIVEEIRPDMDNILLGLSYEDMRDNPNEVSWSWVNAGALPREHSQFPKWMAETHVNPLNNKPIQPWRTKVVEELRNRTKKATVGFEHYERAIETFSWKKYGRAQSVFRLGNAYVEDSALELEYMGNRKDEPDRGTLAVLSADETNTKVILNIQDVTRVSCCSEPGAPRIAIHTKSANISGEPPLRLQFAGDMEMEEWLATLSYVCAQINATNKTPSTRSIWCTSTWGEVFVSDPSVAEAGGDCGDKRTHEFDVYKKSTPITEFLQNRFLPGSSITLVGRPYKDTERFNIDLVCGKVSGSSSMLINNIKQDVALHFNPRFDQGVFVLNSFRNGAWDKEERPSTCPLDKVLGLDMTWVIKIECDQDCFQIFVNGGDMQTSFKHRIEPQKITHVRIEGNLQLIKLSYYSTFYLPPTDMYWRQMGGHLWRVESSTAGVTWGIGYDCAPWYYTGAYGGSFLKGLAPSSADLNLMKDTHSYHVYEYQRWNPVTGYTSHLLPTDRHMWSDATGRHKKTRESIKLLSMHWQWVTEWAVDFNLAGGVDKDGWQYALDFPASYHAKKGFTDYVRRRRWFRKAQLTLFGPWHEIGSTKLLDVSIWAGDNLSPNSPITVWAVTNNGEAVIRKSVTVDSPGGASWEHIDSDEPLVSISCGSEGHVWAVGRNGSAYWRFGVSASNPQGDVWQCVDPPEGAHIRQISVGYCGVWAVDSKGRISVRYEVSRLFPEGTHWLILPSPKCDSSNATDATGATLLTPATPLVTSEGWRHVSAGPMENGDVWAITTSGVLYHRQGISRQQPEGTAWSDGVSGNWQHVSCRGWTIYQDEVKKN